MLASRLVGPGKSVSSSMQEPDHSPFIDVLQSKQSIFITIPLQGQEEENEDEEMNQL